MFYTTQQLVLLKKKKKKKKKNGKKSQPSQSRNNSCFGLYVPSNLTLLVCGVFGGMFRGTYCSIISSLNLMS
jgi:hypothetical protein